MKWASLNLRGLKRALRVIYKDIPPGPYYVWNVHDDGEDLVSVEDALEGVVRSARSQYGYGRIYNLCFGCLVLKRGQVDHTELRFSDTPRYSSRQSKYFKEHQS